MYYVYVLVNQKKVLYKGFTKDLKTRFVAHNSGKVRSTKNGKPWRLIYYQGFENEKDARRDISKNWERARKVEIRVGRHNE